MVFARSMTLMATLLAATSVMNCSADDLSFDDYTKFYFGYVDAVMSIDLQGQMDQCANVVPEAQNTISSALDEMDKTSDFWMPLDQKIQKITDAFTRMVMITPNMITNLLNCPAIKGNSDQLMDWLNQNNDPNQMMQKI